MLEKYEELEIEIVTFASEDIITTSGYDYDYDEDLDGEFIDGWD